MNLTPRERFIVHLMMVDRFGTENALAYDNAMDLLDANATSYYEPEMAGDGRCPECGYELAYGWIEEDECSQQVSEIVESNQVDPEIVLWTLRKQRCKNLSEEDVAELMQDVEDEQILSAPILEQCKSFAETNTSATDFVAPDPYYEWQTKKTKAKFSQSIEKDFQ